MVIFVVSPEMVLSSLIRRVLVRLRMSEGVRGSVLEEALEEAVMTEMIGEWQNGW